VVIIGSTIRIRNKVYDFDGTTPLEPDSHEVKIYNSQGELKDTLTEVETESAGVYYIDYTLAGIPDGYWKVVWKVVKDAIVDIARLKFNVEEP